MVKTIINPKDKNTLQWLYHGSKSQIKKMILLFFGDIFLSVSVVLFSILCKKLIDCVITGEIGGIRKYGLILLITILFQLIMRFILNLLEEYIKSKLMLIYRGRFLNEILHKDFAQISKYHSGDLLTRMFSDIQIITCGITETFSQLISMVTKLICAVCALYILDKQFTIIFVITGVTLCAITGLFRRKMKYLHKDVQEKESIVRSKLQETIENLLIIKIFRSEKQLEESNATSQKKHFYAQLKLRSFSITANAGFSFIFQMGYLFALLWGTGSISKGIMTYGSLVAVLQLIGMVQSPFTNLSGLLPKFYGMLASAERILEINYLKNEDIVDSNNERNKIYAQLKSIIFQNVCFSYEKKSVLKEINCTIEKGDMLAITGLSGCGKSTLFLLLLGIYPVTSGKIAFSVKQMEFLPGQEMRKLFSYVPQGNVLFSGTVRENICFLKTEKDEEAVWKAAEIACAKEFIEELPNKLDTLIGENSFGLSEGQAQRIAVARAIMDAAPILLLDEATSALDEKTEVCLLENIAALENKTCIIVTHRKAALNVCNRLWSMDDDSIEEIVL